MDPMHPAAHPVCAAPTPRPWRRAHVALAIFLGIALTAEVVAAGLMVVAAHGPDHGSANELTIDGRPSGIYRLTVVSGGRLLPSAEPVVEASQPDVQLTADQAQSQNVGWTSNCLVWGELGVLGQDEVTRCALSAQPPPVGYSGPAVGPSSKLAHALAYADSLFDINGDLRVAATGDLAAIVQTDHSGHLHSQVRVGAIGGVPQKAQAAAAAGVDLLVVPVDNAAEFMAQPELARAGVEVVPADTLAQAVVIVGRRAHADVITSRFGDQ